MKKIYRDKKNDNIRVQCETLKVKIQDTFSVV